MSSDDPLHNTSAASHSSEKTQAAAFGDVSPGQNSGRSCEKGPVNQSFNRLE